VHKEPYAPYVSATYVRCTCEAVQLRHPCKWSSLSSHVKWFNLGTHVKRSIAQYNRGQSLELSYVTVPGPD